MTVFAISLIGQHDLNQMKLIFNIIKPIIHIIGSIFSIGKKQIETHFAILYIFLLNGYSFKDVLYLLKQSDHETGYLTSGFSLTFNNVFGMHYPYTRPTTALGKVTGDGGEVSTYSDIYDSVYDRYLWDKYNDIHNSTNYQFDVLDHNYNLNPNYNNIVNSLQQPPLYPFIIFSIILTITIIFLIK